MAISNSASGFRPGVCTSTTRPQSPYNGFVIYETDTKQTLVWQGSAWVMLTDADQPPGLQLVTTHTFTNQATTNIENCFPQEFNCFRFVAQVGTVSGGGYMTARLLDGSSASTSNYVSKSNWLNLQTSTRTFDDADARTDRFSIGTIGDGANTINTFELLNPNKALVTSMSGSGVGYFGTTQWLQVNGGLHTFTFAYNGFQLIANGPNISGTVKIYGYRN